MAQLEEIKTAEQLDKLLGPALERNRAAPADWPPNLSIKPINKGQVLFVSGGETYALWMTKDDKFVGIPERSVQALIDRETALPLAQLYDRIRVAQNTQRDKRYELKKDQDVERFLGEKGVPITADKKVPVEAFVKSHILDDRLGSTESHLTPAERLLYKTAIGHYEPNGGSSGNKTDPAYSIDPAAIKGSTMITLMTPQQAQPAQNLDNAAAKPAPQDAKPAQPSTTPAQNVQNAEPPLFDLQPYKDGKTTVLVHEANGEDKKYSVWLKGGKQVLVNPDDFEKIMDAQGRVPLTDALKEKIRASKQGPDEKKWTPAELKRHFELNNANIADGKIAVLDLMKRGVYGAKDPQLVAWNNQVLAFSDATVNSASAKPERTIAANSLKPGEIYTLPTQTSVSAAAAAAPPNPLGSGVDTLKKFAAQNYSVQYKPTPDQSKINNARHYMQSIEAKMRPFFASDGKDKEAGDYVLSYAAKMPEEYREVARRYVRDNLAEMNKPMDKRKFITAEDAIKGIESQKILPPELPRATTPPPSTSPPPPDSTMTLPPNVPDNPAGRIIANKVALTIFDAVADGSLRKDKAENFIKAFDKFPDHLYANLLREATPGGGVAAGSANEHIRQTLQNRPAMHTSQSLQPSPAVPEQTPPQPKAEVVAVPPRMASMQQSDEIIARYNSSLQSSLKDADPLMREGVYDPEFRYYNTALNLCRAIENSQISNDPSSINKIIDIFKSRDAGLTQNEKFSNAFEKLKAGAPLSEVQVQLKEAYANRRADIEKSPVILKARALDSEDDLHRVALQQIGFFLENPEKGKITVESNYPYLLKEEKDTGVKYVEVLKRLVSGQEDKGAATREIEKIHADRLKEINATPAAAKPIANVRGNGANAEDFINEGRIVTPLHPLPPAFMAAALGTSVRGYDGPNAQPYQGNGANKVGLEDNKIPESKNTAVGTPKFG